MNDAAKFYMDNVKDTKSSGWSNGGKRRLQEQCWNLEATYKKLFDCIKVDVIAVFIQPCNCSYLVPCIPVSNLSKLKFYPDNPGVQKPSPNPSETIDLAATNNRYSITLYAFYISFQ